MTTQRWFISIPPAGAARVVALHAADAIKNRLGIQNIKVFDCLAYQNGFANLLKVNDEDISVDLLNQSLVVSCLDFDATVFLSGALSPVTLFTLRLLKKQNIKTIHWFYESYKRASYWQMVVSGYDHFLAIQKGPIPGFCSRNGSKYHFLPTVCSSCDDGELSPEREFDAAFIGIPSRYRIEVLETLAASGLRLAIAGSGWRNYDGPLRAMILNDSWTDQSRSAQILKNCKIGLNLSVDDPAGDADTHISPRVYDVLAAGCILLTENVPLLYDSLQGCRFHTFSSQDEICGIVKGILESYSTEFSYTESNRRIILQSHRYENRIDELLAVTA